MPAHREPADGRHRAGAARTSHRGRRASTVCAALLVLGGALALTPVIDRDRPAAGAADAAGAAAAPAGSPTTRDAASSDDDWTGGLTRAPFAGSSVAPSGATSSSRVPESRLQNPVAPTASPAAAGVPVRVRMDRLDIDTKLDRLGVTASGVLQTPRSFRRAAWFAQGVRPGDTGPAVIAGHVDSRSGPAVFFALRRARQGDEIDVRDSVGVLRRFDVTAIRRYAKTSFATTEVYGPTAQPQLRLITCTGVFDPAERSYRDNLVVFATERQARAG